MLSIISKFSLPIIKNPIDHHEKPCNHTSNPTLRSGQKKKKNRTSTSAGTREKKIIVPRSGPPSRQSQRVSSASRPTIGPHLPAISPNQHSLDFTFLPNRYTTAVAPLSLASLFLAIDHRDAPADPPRPIRNKDTQHLQPLSSEKKWRGRRPPTACEHAP